MLVKLLTNQIIEWWPIFDSHINATVPGDDPMKMLNIKTALLKGDMDLWILQGNESKQLVPYGIVLTTTTTDVCVNVRSLLLYCVYGYKLVEATQWLLGWETLKAHAKAMGCSRIVAYSSVDRIVEVARELGMDTSQRYLTYEVA